ncbi:precorrin-6y C5,15-methyltransferase (decarboxylating) subunit CbiE|uniref:Precorrin-6Y C5,15-methyltransferase (Decarboxylating) n=1 Tax=Dendrosporobacter quercicolus TaxID=146817 RepID=A0A1G9LHS8_9FIRM|nr:precorrin-6y C5,15-methyltransferase (decarboxylating) subunit CbiE [Dendrosporobacter quercicolus]NSL46716.1 precorrin-6y C5,15-methyltransferase (decarboxylating) subunit CbiE [Dendrosporobacter quercicolus DSM 1736]SDL61464.1 precorrin-6Y C5,15-methyltransferase (decarboxylating) [Dendrosporobacter quercicolus]
MDYKIIVAGIGPGSPDYLLPVAKQAIDAAKVIVGSKRALAAFAPESAVQKTIGGDIDEVLQFIEAYRKRGDVVVMVSGDPGYFSLLAALRTLFPPEQLTVIPGVSSFQTAFARLALPWQDAELISMHGRQPQTDRLTYRPGKKLGMLTDPCYQPARIAGLLLELGWPASTPAWICAGLSYDGEEIIRSDLARLRDTEGFSHCVMVVTA